MMNNWVERYIYAVGEKIPKKQRLDSEKKLRTAIEIVIREITEEKKATDENYEITQEDIFEILEAFGSPEETAKRYNTNPRYLIGPELFDLYKFAVVVVGLCVCFGIVVGTFVSILSTIGNTEKIIFRLPMQLLSSGFSTIGAVTAIFALIQYFSKEPGKILNKTIPWKPNMLKAIPEISSRIRRRETIISLTFTTLAIIVFNLFPDRIAIYSISYKGTFFVPIFNLEVLKQNMIFLNIFWFFQIGVYFYHIKTRQWTLISRWITIIISIGTLGVILKMASNPSILSNALDTLYMPNQMVSIREFAFVFFKGILALIVASTAYEVVRHIYYITRKKTN